MAESTKANKSLCDISFNITSKLMKSLDTDRGWEMLAAEAGYNFDEIQLLSLAQNQADGSPTRSLLWQLGCRGYTVSDLYDKLKSAGRLREMQILETYVKEGGQEKKGAAIEKKISDSSLLFSLPHHLNQVKISDQKSSARAESGFSMSGSEINFNHPSFIGKSKTTVGGSKNYEDKFIPGTEGRSPGSSFGTCIKETDEKGSKIPDGSLIKDYTIPHKSLPPSFLPSFCDRQAGRPSPSGAETIRIMLSGHSLPTLSDSRSSSESTVENTSQKPDQGIKKQLDLSPLSRPAEAALTHKTCFSYRTLFSATEGFSERKLLGEGAFGKVYLGTIQQLDCAIKKIQSSPADKKSDQVESELAALLKFRHENIVTLYGYAQNETELFLVYQYYFGGSLEDRLQRKNNTPSLNWERRLNILVGACKGLNFLHTLEDVPLIHGDIKSANILLDKYCEAKIGDLGQARYGTSQSTESSGFTHITVAQSRTKIFGTNAYLAPELKSDCKLSVKSDVYALGVVFLEVCSGLEAYDQSRNENKFLVDYFNTNVWEEDKILWKERVQDRTMADVPDDIFVDVLKLAQRCVAKLKKPRPDTVKLLSEMKDIYRRNMERINDVIITESIPISLQINSRTSSCVTPSDTGSQRGEQVYSYSLLQTYDSAQQENIRLKQEQRIQEFNSNKIVKSALQDQSPLKVLPPECSVEMRNYPGPGSTVQSMPSDAPLSEAVRLQIAYDRQLERKKIDRLSTQSLKENQLVEEYPSDSQKLQQIYEFDQSQQKSMPCQCEVLEKCSNLQDNFPQADPKKLAQLTAYDEANFSKSNPTDDDHSSLECDPVKLAFLKDFDDNVFRQLVKKDNCSDTEQTNAVETNQGLYKHRENLEQTPTGQQILLSQTGLPSNFTTDVSGSRPVYESYYTHQGMNENNDFRYIKVDESHLNAGRESEFLNDASDHNGNRRPSDDSNIINGWTQGVSDIRTEKLHIEKPGKDKINKLFSKYLALQNTDDCKNDDDGDCDTESVEETNI